MRSVLPERYQEAGRAISKLHNIRVLVLLVAFMSGMALFVLFPRKYLPPINLGAWAIGYLLVLGFGVFAGIYGIARYDIRKAIELGYLCPHCGESLYSSKGFEKITGRCPKCAKRIE